MHEYGLVSGILRRVEEEAQRHGAHRVHRIFVSVGELAGVDPELLVRAYDTFRERTVCAAADLEVRTVRARWACKRCQAPLERGAILACACGGRAQLLEGDDLILDRIELDVA